jgi:nicotinamidase-related amidase
MTGHTYDKATSALLLVDPYNDFLSEGGKVWPRVREIALVAVQLDLEYRSRRFTNGASLMTARSSAARPMSRPLSLGRRQGD